MLELNWSIIWTIVNILVLYLLLRKFLYAPVMKVIQARQEQVDSSLTQAKEAQTQAQQAQTQARQRLEQVETEARQREQDYEAQARQQAQALLDQAREEAAQLVAQGKEEARREREQMLRQAGQETADLACDLAGKLVGRSLNSSDERRLLDQLMDKVGEYHGK